MTNSVLKRKLSLRDKRKKRVRGKIFGTLEIPRVCIYKSNKTLYVQAINDVLGQTLAQSNGLKLSIKANKEGAVSLAKDFAAKLNDKNIVKVKFDRNGYLYHGVIATFADSLREHGIKL